VPSSSITLPALSTAFRSALIEEQHVRTATRTPPPFASVVRSALAAADHSLAFFLVGVSACQDMTNVPTQFPSRLGVAAQLDGGRNKVTAPWGPKEVLPDPTVNQTRLSQHQGEHAGARDRRSG
jgi:hypothetical protein